MNSSTFNFAFIYFCCLGSNKIFEFWKSSCLEGYLILRGIKSGNYSNPSFPGFEKDFLTLLFDFGEERISGLSRKR